MKVPSISIILLKMTHSMAISFIYIFRAINFLTTLKHTYFVVTNLKPKKSGY